MPDEDGYDLIRNIRAIENVPTTTAIAITGYARDEDRERALSAGFNMFLSKPVDLDKLVGLIASIGQD